MFDGRDDHTAVSYVEMYWNYRSVTGRIIYSKLPHTNKMGVHYFIILPFLVALGFIHPLFIVVIFYSSSLCSLHPPPFPRSSSLSSSSSSFPSLSFWCTAVYVLLAPHTHIPQGTLFSINWFGDMIRQFFENLNFFKLNHPLSLFLSMPFTCFLCCFSCLVSCVSVRVVCVSCVLYVLFLFFLKILGRFDRSAGASPATICSAHRRPEGG